MLKENPVVGFCANKLDPNPSVEVVLVAAGAEVCVPKPPSVNPPVPAAGVLEKIWTLKILYYIKIYLHLNNIYIFILYIHFSKSI